LKAITLHQPFATLVSIGAKKYETRTWAPEDYRGPLAIHAGKKTDELPLFWDESFCEVLQPAGYEGPETLPLGAVVCIATLAECISTNHTQFPEDSPKDWLAFGDFGPDRWAWKLTNIKRLDPPIPARGYQNLWDWDAPPEVLALL